MLATENLKIDESDDIADYARDGRLVAPSDGKRYEWRRLIDRAEQLGRPLTEKEMEQYRIR